jgi:hypothetical protein
MEYQVDLDPEHSVIRLTVTAEIVTLGLAEECYVRLSQLSSSGGPYAAIYDLSATKDTTFTTELVRLSLAAVHPSQQEGRKWLWATTR